MKRIILSLIIALPLCTYAQRHSVGISAVELNGGILPEAGCGPTASVGYSTYLSSKSILRFSADYMNNNIKLYQDRFNVADYGISADWQRTLLTNRTNYFINFGGGMMVGYEDIGSIKTKYNENGLKNDMKSRFIVSPFISASAELFIKNNTAIIFNIRKSYTPLSDVKNWNSVVSVGIKQLLF